MEDDSGIETVAALQELGFEPNPNVYSDLHPGLRYDFGNFRLSVGFGLTPRFVYAAYFGGVLSTSRTVADVDFEMPLRIESHEQCAAWIADCLDRSSNGRFEPTIVTLWLEEGRRRRDTLPWVRQQAAYEARPHCMVERDWLRVALRTLTKTVASASNDQSVVLSFSEGVLTIRCAAHVIALPASGRSWASAYAIPAGKLQRLPKRLQRNRLGIEIWESKLTIASSVYSGVVEVPQR